MHHQLSSILWACNYTEVFWWSSATYSGTINKIFCRCWTHASFLLKQGHVCPVIVFQVYWEGPVSAAMVAAILYAVIIYWHQEMSPSVKKKITPVLLWLNIRKFHFRASSEGCYRSSSTYCIFGSNKMLFQLKTPSTSSLWHSNVWSAVHLFPGLSFFSSPVHTNLFTINTEVSTCWFAS